MGKQVGEVCHHCRRIVEAPCRTRDIAIGCVNFHAPHPTADAVVRPAHYTRFKIEPIHFIMENDLPFWLGNIIKYVCRWDAKDGIQDLEKAGRYIEMKVKQLKGDARWSE